MTTSSTYSVQYSRDDLVTAALRKLGVIADGQTPTATNLLNGTMALNMAIGMLRSKGLPLWARTTYSFTPTVASVTIGTGQTYNTPYPLKLLQAIRTQNGTVIDMNIEADSDFNILPTNSTGVPIKIAYQPLNNYGVIRLWPTPDSTASTSTITLVYQRPFQYFVNSTDTADFPEEWYLPLVYQTAVLLAPEWGIPTMDRNMLKEELKTYLENTLDMGQEDASLFIQPRRK